MSTTVRIIVMEPAEKFIVGHSSEQPNLKALLDIEDVDTSYLSIGMKMIDLHPGLGKLYQSLRGT